MAEVVSMRGEPITAPGEPIDEVVALARDILQRAEAGALRGIVACVVNSDDTFQAATAGAFGGYGMLGLMGHQMHILNAAMREEDE